MGCWLCASSSSSAAICSAPGAVSSASTSGASGDVDGKGSMSWGRDSTTGPWRPASAVEKARPTISAMRSGSLISATHLAMPPKKAR